MAKNQDPRSHQSEFQPMFEHFRSELDEHHDRRERVIKASRDITAASKKIIFTLQRIRKLGEPLPGHVEKSNKQYYDTITTQFQNVTKDLQGLNSYRYARQVSGGCQEYMEAVLFEHYLAHASILSYDEAAKKVQQLSSSSSTSNPTSQVNEEDGSVSSVNLTYEDYLLGVYDMTGEAMRFAITSMATNGALPSVTKDPDAMDDSPRDVLTDLRTLRAALARLDAGKGPFAKEVDKKADVMRASVEKVEKALYGLIVRGAERPKGWVPDVPTYPVEVEG